MASEIRVNQIQNRSGLGTVTFTDTGAVLSGVITARTFIGDGGSNTGGGGGGTGYGANTSTGCVSGNGGSGIVVIAYPT